MTDIALIVAAIAIGLTLLNIFGKVFTNPGKTLNSKFVKFGTLTGKSKAEIVNAVGPYNSTTSNSDGSSTCTWIADWYAIVLLFDANNKCLKIIHQKLK